MSRYNFLTYTKTPPDMLLMDYLDGDAPFSVPVALESSDGVRVYRSTQELMPIASPLFFAQLIDYSRENRDEEGNCDLLPLLTVVGAAIEEKIVDIPDSSLPDELWEETAQQAMMESLTGSLPYCLFDEEGRAWQANTYDALYDLFSCYTVRTFGDDKDPETCWRVFAEDSGLDEAAKFIDANMMNLVWATLDKDKALHNPSDVYIADDEQFIVRYQGSDTLMSDAADFAAHISFDAESEDDAVDIVSFLVRYKVFLRPIYADLGRALESCPAFVDGGWGDFPYIAEKIDDPAVQSRIASMNNFLDFICDMSIQEWIEECFPEFPDVADLAAAFMEGTKIYRRY